MPQFPHHSKLCHCCQSIAYLSPEIMAEKSTKDGDLTLTKKLIHGDFPTGELFFQARMLEKRNTVDPLNPWMLLGLHMLSPGWIWPPSCHFSQLSDLLPSGDIRFKGKFAFIFLTTGWSLNTQANKCALWHAKKWISKSYSYSDIVRGTIRLGLTLSLQWAF